MPEANGAKGNNQQQAYDAEKDKTQECEILIGNGSMRKILEGATPEQERELLGLDDFFRFDEEPAPKKKAKPKAAELKKMENLSEPGYQALDNLSPDELMDTVVSTYYEPSFMHPKIETIISHHWDDIFSKARCNWRVILRKPDSVIFHLQCGEAILCQPFPKCKGMYEAVILNSRGKTIRKVTQETPRTLEEAVKECEEEFCRIPATMDTCRTKFGWIDGAGYDAVLHDTFEEYLRAQKISLGGVLADLRTLGLSEENLERLKETSLTHAYYVLDKLKNDVVPTREELIKAEKLYTCVMRLSKRDMLYVNRNAPMGFAVLEGMPKARTLTISFINFDKLTPTDQKALKAEILDMVNERIQEYLQKTKSKGTSQKLAS